jgi:enterochelin esterase-like enzyme
MRSLIAVYVQPVHRDREYSRQAAETVIPLFITKELLPFIDAGYRTIRDPERRALAGISNGGKSLYG